jgi:hypothetical protein
MAPVSMPPQQRPQQDLRQSLQQVQISAPSPRQLSPVERAELRRQLIEYDRQPPPARGCSRSPDTSRMRRTTMLASLLLAAAAASAQTVPPPQNVLQLQPAEPWKCSRTCCR